MKSLFVRRSIQLSLVFALSQPGASEAYYGKNAREAILTYQAPIELEKGASNTRIREAIEAQIQHHMGTFQSLSFADSFGHPGVLGEDHRVKILSKKKGRTSDTQTVTYSFSGKVVFKKSAFNGNATRKVPLKLPLNPDQIYSLGLDEDGFNHCTDEHYNSEGDFWYFWDPEMKGCPLRGNNEDVVRIKGDLRPLPNTTSSYPEYDRLYSNNGNGKNLDISVFFGYIADITNINAPKRKDDAFAAMRYVEKDLRERGFKRTATRDEFRVYANGTFHKGGNFWRVYEKPIQTLAGEIRLRVKILLADTDLSSSDATFHHYLIPALEESDIVVYDGHSGLGGNLDITQFPDLRFNKSKYQIMFFNGCSSYPYFNGIYFEAKGGSANLDVITSGLATMSSTSGPNVIAFLNRFIEGDTVSYQTILRELEYSNGDEGTYLTGVSGDEDNVFRP